jgi:hypothetical protein
LNRPRTNPRAWQRSPSGRPFLAGCIEARSMLAGRTNPALAGSGVGCELAGRTRPVGTQSGAASWPSPHMSKNHSFSGPPPFRVPLTYARARVGSTDFAQAAMKPSCERRGSRAAVLRRRERTRFIVGERRRSRRILDVRAADLQEGWRNNAFPFRQRRRRRRQPSEHRSERSEQSNTARCASSYET